MPEAPHADLFSLPTVSRWAEGYRPHAARECFLPEMPPSARGFFAAALVANTGRSLLVLAERFREMDETAAAIEVWLGADSSLAFPPIEIVRPSASPDPEISAQRLATLMALRRAGASTAPPPCVVTTRQAMDQPVPMPDTMDRRLLCIHTGDDVGLDNLVEKLDKAEYLRVNQVDDRGQFATRGGVLDVFSTDADWPIRLEFYGDRVQSIREFSVEDQLTRRILDKGVVLLGTEEEPRGKLADWLPSDHLLLDCEPDLDAGSSDAPACLPHDFLRVMKDDDLLLHEQRRALLLKHIEDWRAEQWRIIIFCNNEGECQRLKEILADESGRVTGIDFRIGHLASGFTILEDRLAILSDAEIFGRYQHIPPYRAKGGRAGRGAAGVAGDIETWNEGDYVVHLQHGIARYLGLHPVNLGGPRDEEVLVLEFADAAKLYVPVEQAHIVSRYVGIGRKKPEVDALGGSRWERARIRAHRAILDYAANLLRLQAEREALPGYPFPPDTAWQREFENAFIYDETADQLRAIAETKTDMESPRPMDRLICGDVGFGKTEVAIRGAFKAVMSGKQVAFLCPTTVLAQQHFNTLHERMADYPVRIEMLSRFVSQAQQARLVRSLAAGEIDIIVGTHRLLSPDVRFKNVGLLVVDEEQRFGVRHKDMLKDRFRQIDILTLSATPIPRTLYLALMGARDMSTIETPPPGRIPVETAITGYDERVIRDSIQREIARDGQVFYLHNRIETIGHVAARLQELVPGVRVVVGHGRMPDEELEDVMMAFVSGKADVLVSTTIIESGLDIPNANTIIIDRADRFGLADLYQLRGRVGRGQHKAYAYLLLPPALMTTGEAKRRTAAIRQYSQLGAGFKIAMRDLEIRGAGNLLGTEQSGHVMAIGFDLYCRLLRQAVQQIKSGKVAHRREVPVQIDFLALSEARAEDGRLPAYLPARFLRQPALRITAHRELAEAASEEELDALAVRWRDRFGNLPPEAENLILYRRIQLHAAKKALRDIEVIGNQLRIRKGADFIMIGTRFPRLSQSDPAARLREIFSLVQKLA